MKILMLVSELPPIRSGVSRCAERLISGLRSTGHAVDAISSHDVPRYSIGEFRFSSFARYWPRIAKQMAQYDIVNVHGPVPMMSDLCLALSQTVATIRRPPIVYTHHCSIDIAGWTHMCRIYNRLHRALTAGADRVVTTTESYRRMIEARGGPPVSVIPWGVDNHVYGKPRRAPRAPGEPLRVLFVGQMRPYKGIPHLIEATAGDDRFRVTFVGSGPQESAYRREAENFGARNIRFLGRVSDEDLTQLYGEQDVVTLPSTTHAEAFGLVLLEGMAAGCVPVASDLPGVRDVADSTGILVRPGDSADLRRALAALASEPTRVWHLSRASQARARAMGWDSVVQSYIQLFREALADWHAREASAALPGTWRSPEPLMASLRTLFGASWSSLLLFDRSREPTARAAWGRVEREQLHSEMPRIAQHVARTKRPLVIDKELAPNDIRGWMVRDDVSSALSVPIRARRGSLVLNLSIASDSERRFTPGDLETLVRLTSSRDFAAAHQRLGLTADLL